MINSNVKPFIKAESYFVVARLFEDDDAPKKTMLLTITSTGKDGTKDVLQLANKDIPKHQFEKEECQQGATFSSIKQEDMKVTTSTR